MAGMNSVLTALPAIQQGVSIFNAATASSNLADEQATATAELQRKQNKQLAQAQADAALERERLNLNAAEDERNRRAQLKRAVARQRASSAAQGLTDGGSSEAVLLGLFQESDAEREERERLDSLRLGALDNDLAQRQSLNALQRTELVERQRLERASEPSPLEFGLNFASRLF